MPVSGSAIASSIESDTGFDYAIPDQPYNKNWVAQVGSVMENMWTAGSTKEAPGAPSPPPSPPPPYSPWSHTHDSGADGMSVGSGSIGSALSKVVFDAIVGAVLGEVSSDLATPSGIATWVPAEVPHTHAPISSVGSYSSAINSAVDGLQATVGGVEITINLSEAPELQKMLDSIASEVETELKNNGLLSTDTDGGSGTHVHTLS